MFKIYKVIKKCKKLILTYKVKHRYYKGFKYISMTEKLLNI